MFVELLTGVRIDRSPVGAGMRVVVPADVGGYVLDQGWGRKVGSGHRIGDDRQLLALRARQIPGTDAELSEWPSWMRPAWVRPAGRVALHGGDRLWVPVRCRSCPRYSYGLKDHLPAGAERETRSDAWLSECKSCRTGD